ncbi:MAG: DUF4855 domain-containing protein [Limnochordales bacterium]|nr:DUF4855 domain-containing protein [Limnochordales bacterium]
MRRSIPPNRTLPMLMAALFAVTVAASTVDLAGYKGGDVVIAASPPTTAETAETADLGYLRPGPVEEGWPADAVLIYCGYYAPGRTGLTELHGESYAGTVRDDDGDWLAIDFRPYVTHLDSTGEPDDTFFDTFIFLGLSSPRGRDFAGEYDQSRASLWWDWQWFIERLYAPGKQLQALEAAVAKAAASLNRPELIVNVYLMIPYPSYKVTDFGTLDGQPGGQSLLPVENRLAAVRWYVDEVIKRWQAWQPKHLRLAGFYWLQEHVNPAVPGETVLVRGTAEYVHKLGYKLGWIPWSGAYLATSWRDFGFDWAVIQPNHMFQNKPGLIESAVQKARQARMGIEIELDGRVNQPEGLRKLYDYLDGGVRYGYMKNALTAYYQDVAMLARLYAAGETQRQIYDDIYEFVKGTYPQPTPAAEWISGVVVDETGAPVPGARVQALSAVAFTDSNGQFRLPGIYRRNVYLMISRSDQQKPGVLIWPYVSPRVNVAAATQSDTLRLVLEPEQSTRIMPLLDFETPEETEGLVALGWTMSRAQTVRTRGEYSLELAARSTGLAGLQSLSWNIDSTAAISDWRGYSAFALDLLVPGEAEAENSGPTTITFLLTLLDEEGGRYTRLYPVTVLPDAIDADGREADGKGRGWQTLVVPLEGAASGLEHVDTPGSGEPGGINPGTVVRVSLAVLQPPGPSRIYIDNLRLIR